MSACRRDAAGWAWRVGSLWRERVRDDGIMTAAIAGCFAASIYAALLSRVCVLFSICVFAIDPYCVRCQLMRSLAAIRVCGRKRHRWVLGVHCRRIGAGLRIDVHQQREASRGDMRSRRGVEHVIAQVMAPSGDARLLLHTTYALKDLGEGLGLGFYHRAREPRLGIVLEHSEDTACGQSRLVC